MMREGKEALSHELGRESFFCFLKAVSQACPETSLIAVSKFGQVPRFPDIPEQLQYRHYGAEQRRWQTENDRSF
jgi:hypothetical protein